MSKSEQLQEEAFGNESLLVLADSVEQMCQILRNLEGNLTGIGDPSAQAEMAMKCVKILLEEAGSRLEHICKTTIYLTDRSYREEVYTVIGKHLKGIHVCSTGLIVQGLARPEMVMEIDVEAIIPENM